MLRTRLSDDWKLDRSSKPRIGGDTDLITNCSFFPDVLSSTSICVLWRFMSAIPPLFPEQQHAYCDTSCCVYQGVDYSHIKSLDNRLHLLHTLNNCDQV
jgi:hypothetical protein